ncbi:MAG: hypothetical protein Q4F28_00770 [Eubacteriales bacterium]|nr:hypothetical protein [Eubacteriales bacterium]
MKSYILRFGVLFLLGVFIGWNYPERSVEKRDFEIIHSYSYVGGGYKTTTLSVIVNIEDYDTGEMLERVKKYHYERNSVSNELTIKLYDGRSAFENHRCRIERTYISDRGD